GAAGPRAGQRPRQAGRPAAQRDDVRVDRGADEPLHADHGGLRHQATAGRSVRRGGGGERRARLLRRVRRHRPAVPGPLPAAVPAADGGAPPDDRGRDGRGPHPHVRLGEHDRRRAGPVTAAPVAFSETQLTEVRRLQGLYPDARAALLPVLHLAQETFGYVSLEVEEYVAALFDLTPAHVHEVVTFYTLFFRE